MLRAQDTGGESGYTVERGSLGRGSLQVSDGKQVPVGMQAPGISLALPLSRVSSDGCEWLLVDMFNRLPQYILPEHLLHLTNLPP